MMSQKNLKYKDVNFFYKTEDSLNLILNPRTDFFLYFSEF